MRHAKAGELPGGPDIERALKARGRSDSAAAGEWLRSSGYLPDLVLCSAARRARQTWQYMAEQLGTEPEVMVERGLYEADADAVLDLVRQASDAARTVMYIGHNPAAAELVMMLTGAELDFPAAAMAVIGVAGQWRELAPRQGELVDSWAPAPG